jgi:hypothetical protein
VVDRDAERTRFLRGLALVGAIVALLLAWLGWGLGGETTVLYVDDVATLLAAVGASALCFQAGTRHEGQLRRFWRLLAGACGAWATGELIWAWYDLVLGQDVPVPSWADPAYLAAIPLAGAALLSHPAMRGSATRRARSILDGLVIATALLFLSWTLVLGPLSRANDLTTLGGLVTLAYPFGDVVIVFLVVLVVRRMGEGDRVALWCLLVGLLAVTLSDATYGYLTEVRSYETGSVIDVGWIVGYLAIALGAYQSRGGAGIEHTAESPGLTPAALLTPFVPMLIALTVAAVQMELGRRLDRVTWSMALALVVLVLVRQVLLFVALLRPGAERDTRVSDRLVTALAGAAPDAGRATPSPTAGA